MIGAVSDEFPQGLATQQIGNFDRNPPKRLVFRIDDVPSAIHIARFG